MKAYDLVLLSQEKNVLKKIKVVVVLGQNLGQIRSNVVKKTKKWALSLVFFHILLREYLLKQDLVVVKPPEWTFMAAIARNAKFKGCKWMQIFARFGSKMAKNLIICNNFTLVSQPYSHKIDNNMISVFLNWNSV